MQPVTLPDTHARMRCLSPGMVLPCSSLMTDASAAVYLLDVSARTARHAQAGSSLGLGASASLVPGHELLQVCMMSFLSPAVPVSLTAFGLCSSVAGAQQVSSES